MCGLGAILRIRDSGSRSAEESIPDSWIDEIDAAIAHRGPDGAGRFRGSFTRTDEAILDVAIVHRRLAIIDPADGHQPIVREIPGEGVLALAFNGCIYNHRALRAELESFGHRFTTNHSDTEAILVGWIAWGSDVFRRLDGMFSAVLWDGRTGSLIAARDAFGEKPLLGWSADGIACAANVPLGVSNFRRACAPSWRINLSADSASQVASLLYCGAAPWNGTFDGISQAQPGHAYDLSSPRAAELQQPFNASQQVAGYAPIGPRPASSKVAPPSIDDFEHALRAAVVERLEADVPIAALLSGGVDSSLICAFARDAKPDLRSFCVAMPEADFDESKHAAHVAHHLGIQHQTITASPHPADDLIKLVQLLGQPFGDSSLLPTYWACREASTHARVLLTGDGGDELFRGYQRYSAATPLRWLRHFGPLLPLIPCSVLERADPRSKPAKLARLIQAARHQGYRDLVAIFPPAELERLLGPAAAKTACGPSLVDDEHRWELQNHFPNILLRKVDHAAMVAGIECRAPFLDSHLAQMALTLPSELLCPDGERKGLLRAIARRHVPQEAIDRPKQGFSIPIGRWFRSDFGGLRTLLTDALGSADPFPTQLLGCEIDVGAARQFLDEHLNGRRDHAQRLFLLLTVAIWCQLGTRSANHA